MCQLLCGFEVTSASLTYAHAIISDSGLEDRILRLSVKDGGKDVVISVTPLIASPSHTHVLPNASLICDRTILGERGTDGSDAERLRLSKRNEAEQWTEL